MTLVYLDHCNQLFLAASASLLGTACIVMRKVAKKKSTAAAQKSVKPEAKRVFLVDDHPVVREHLKLLLDKDPHLAYCGEAETAAEALNLIKKSPPDIVITDVSLSTGRDGLDFVKDMGVRFPEVPVLVLSMHDESLYAERLLRAGARGYLCKTETTKTILSAIHRVLDGDIHVSEKMSKTMINRFIGVDSKQFGSPIDKLSDRELEIFGQIGRGRSGREIAEFLRLDPKTVETYRSRIKAKLNITHTIELHQHAMQWVQSGAIPPSRP
jgi:DNA-binding NarL/FixJ family response regulator